MTETTTDDALLAEWVDVSLARVAALTGGAAKARARAVAATEERSLLVEELLAAGVSLARIAAAAGVTHGALQSGARALEKKRTNHLHRLAD